MKTGQVVVWFDTTMDADYWWSLLLVWGVPADRPSARVVMWFTEVRR